MQAIVIRAVASGCTPAVAARIVGISRSTLSEWRRKYPRFDEELTRAEAHCLSMLEQTAYSIAVHSRDWRAVQFLLQKRLPTTYGDRASANESYEISITAPPDDGSVPYTVHLATPQQKPTPPPTPHQKPQKP